MLSGQTDTSRPQMTAMSDSQMNKEIANLQRKNFDLKMQIYYLQQKLENEAQKMSNDKSNDISTIIEGRSVDNIALQNQLNDSKKRVGELESELLLMKASDSHQKSDDEKIPTSKTIINSIGSSSNQVDENRRRERQVASAIAAHDAAMISQLDAEAKKLRIQHEKDVLLIEESNEKKNHLVTEICEKEKRITYLSTYIRSMQSKIKRYTKPANTFLFDECIELDDNNDLGVTYNPEHITTEIISSSLTDKEAIAIRQENISLKEQLERERCLLRNQEAILSQVKLSAEELTLLEAEEIVRLEAELARCLDERKLWQKNYKSIEEKNKMLQQRLHDIDEEKKGVLEFRLSENIENAFSKSGNKKFGIANNSFLSTPMTYSTGRNSHDIMQSTNLTPGPSSLSLFSESNKLDLYKKREVELLDALEALVNKCKILEERKERKSEAVSSSSSSSSSSHRKKSGSKSR